MARPKKPKEIKRVLPEGTVIGECDCAGCGTRTPLKENSGGCVYYMCAVIVDPATKERCFSRHTFGRTASRKMIAEFLALKPQEEVTSDVKHIDRTEKNQPDNPSADGGGTEGSGSARHEGADSGAGGGEPTPPAAIEPAKRRGISSWFD